MQRHKEGHFRWDCPDSKKKGNKKGKDIAEESIASEDYASVEVLAITETEACKEWILDSGRSFHMSPNKDWIETLTVVPDGGAYWETTNLAELQAEAQ